MAALVWIAAVIRAVPPPCSPDPTVRPVAEMIPWVTLSVRPSGLPMASTIWPICASLEFANAAGFRSLASASTRITARSSGANSPTTLAVMVLLPTESTTFMVLAVPMTCSLVTMSPLES